MLESVEDTEIVMGSRFAGTTGRGEREINLQTVLISGWGCMAARKLNKLSCF